VIIAQQFGAPPLVVVLCGVGAVAGHNWPLYIRFRGGSGTGTGFGVLIAMAPVVAFTLVIFFLVPVVLTRYMSLGSIMAATATPIIVTLFARDSWIPPEYAYFGVAAAALVLWRHRANMRRLIAGKEARIGERVEISREASNGEAI
jgi:glycerol-3-phosphate acyltransferase PlsY